MKVMSTTASRLKIYDGIACCDVNSDQMMNACISIYLVKGEAEDMELQPLTGRGSIDGFSCLLSRPRYSNEALLDRNPVPVSSAKGGRVRLVDHRNSPASERPKQKSRILLTA